MKGRRKIKTSKWFLKAKFETEVSLIKNTTSINQLRFMKTAVKTGRTNEPVGVMASNSHDNRSTI